MHPGGINEMQREMFCFTVDCFVVALRAISPAKGIHCLSVVDTKYPLLHVPAQVWGKKKKKRTRLDL